MNKKLTKHNIFLDSLQKIDRILLTLIGLSVTAWIIYSTFFAPDNRCGAQNEQMAQIWLGVACISTGSICGYLAAKSIYGSRNKAKDKNPADVDIVGLVTLVGFVLVTGFVSALIFLPLGFRICF